MPRIFLYGTLKRGGCSHHMLAGQVFVGEAETQPRFRLVSLGWYPGLIEVKETGLGIHGEVWEVDDACLAQLNAYEGGEYDLRAISLQEPFHDEVVLAYVLRESARVLLEASRWP